MRLGNSLVVEVGMLMHTVLRLITLQSWEKVLLLGLTVSRRAGGWLLLGPLLLGPLLQGQGGGLFLLLLLGPKLQAGELLLLGLGHLLREGAWVDGRRGVLPLSSAVQVTAVNCVHGRRCVGLLFWARGLLQPL